MLKRLLTPYIKRLIYSKKLVESKYFPNKSSFFVLYEQMNYKKIKEIRELYLHLRNIPHKHSLFSSAIMHYVRLHMNTIQNRKSEYQMRK